jgi:hypothetical protein
MILEKKIVSVASYGRIESLVKTLESIIDQCDVLNVVLNSEINEIPKILLDDKINLVFSDNSYGDAMKFLFLEESEGYYLTIDDDIIYPPNYVEFMISRCKDYNNSRVITLHGRSFGKFPILSYYKSANERYSCFQELKKNVAVQFGGTGVMCFHTSLLKLPLKYFQYPNMADVWIGKHCMENKIEIYCIRHEGNFIKYMDQKTTIHGSYSGNDSLQSKVVNSIFDKTIILGDLYGNMIEETQQENVKINRERSIPIKSTIEVNKKTINYDTVNNVFQQNQRTVVQRPNQSSNNKFNRNNTMIIKSFQKKR